MTDIDLRYKPCYYRNSEHAIDVACFEASLDSDADNIHDAMDNCALITNMGQRNTVSDDYGNICDPDFDNDLIVNAADLAFFKT